MTHPVQVRDVLRLERRAVVIDPLTEYSLIGVFSFGKGIFHREPQPGNALGGYRFFAVDPGDLVLSNIQAWEGAIALAGERDAGTVGTHRFLTYVPRDDRIDTGWARWFFLSEPGMDLIRKAAPGTTIRNRTLAIDRFEVIEIPLPPIDEQRRIAAHLDEVATIVEEATVLSTKSAALSEALSVSLASRPDFSDADRTADGWTRTSLSDILVPARDQVRVDASASYKNFGIYSYGRGVFAKPDIDGLSTSAASLYRVRRGQFVYSKLFAFEGAYSYVPAEFDGYYVSNEFPTFDADPERLDTRWLAAYLRSPARWADLAGASKGIGVRRQRVPTDALLDYEIWLPPIEVQRDTVTVLGELAQVRGSREKSAERIDSLVSAALNAAFAPTG